MFGASSYIGYTLLFCVPALTLMWLRKDFFPILWQNLATIGLSTLILTLYGSLIWPVALKVGAWAYDPGKISGIKLFHYVYLDDVIWWLLIGLVFSSFITLSKYYEDRGRNLLLKEIRGLLRAFLYAFRGFRAISLERNSTIHVTVAIFVILEGVLFKISKQEWFWVILAIGLVLGFELMNTAVERLSTKISSGHDEEIRLIKDAAAAGVLIAALAAAAIGVKIFLARFFLALF